MPQPMKAIALTVGTKELQVVTRPEPTVTGADQIKMQVLQVGVCGTDREEAEGGRAQAPDARQELIIGHEMIGRVIEIGESVTRVQAGDFAVFTVRRGCGHCLPCAMNRSDMCLTGDFTERGIWGMDGYDAQYVVDQEQYVVRVPPELATIGVLTEPTSVVEKAIEEAVRIQTARRPDAGATPDWLYGKPCLVAGLGPIGLLGAMVLKLRHARVYGLDIVDENSPRPQWLKAIGGEYVDGRKVPPEKVKETLGTMQVILEAAGIPALDFNLFDALALDGIFVLTGIPGGARPVQVDGGTVIRQLVLGNQAMAGSVNAARGHYQMAVDDLENANQLWAGHVDKLITNRFPYPDFKQALTEHTADEIKVVVEWAK